MRPIGLIAGEGIFPLLVARGAREAGRTVCCVALTGNAFPELRGEVDEFQWAGILRLGKWCRVLKAGGCNEAIMVGRVVKTRMYSRWRYLQYIPDLRTLRLWMTDLRHDKRPAAMLGAIARTLASEGITLIDSTTYTRDQLTSAGVMTRRRPTDAQMLDARFGWELCRHVSRLDIGQAIAVKDKDVIAVEALEGTNAMIERAGALCRSGGWTLIKVANSSQDMRMDVPTIGLTTIEKLAAAKCVCVVLEVGKTILLEREKVLDAAEQAGIAIVGFEANSPASQGQP